MSSRFGHRNNHRWERTVERLRGLDDNDDNVATGEARNSHLS
jgi:hypothetical protein